MDYNTKIRNLNLSRRQIYNTFKRFFNCSERSFYNYLDGNLEACNIQIKTVVDEFLKEYEKMIIRIGALEESGVVIIKRTVL